MIEEPKSAPTATEWRAAFFAEETDISRICNAAKISLCLAEEIYEKVEDGSTIEAMALAVFALCEAVRTAEAAYYDRFNALVARENAAQGIFG